MSSPEEDELEEINYDEEILDDDETEDSYVMYASFKFADKPMIVRIYYGDVTEEIGYVEVKEF